MKLGRLRQERLNGLFADWIGIKMGEHGLLVVWNDTGSGGIVFLK